MSTLTAANDINRTKDLHYAFILSILGINKTDENGNSVKFYPSPDEAINYICGAITLNQIHGEEDETGENYSEDYSEDKNEDVAEYEYCTFDFLKGE